MHNGHSNFYLYQCRPVPYGSKLQLLPTNHHLLVLSTQQDPYKKAYLLMKNVQDISWKGQENGPLA